MGLREFLTPHNRKILKPFFRYLPEKFKESNNNSRAQRKKNGKCWGMSNGNLMGFFWNEEILLRQGFTFSKLVDNFLIT